MPVTMESLEHLMGVCLGSLIGFQFLLAYYCCYVLPEIREAVAHLFRGRVGVKWHLMRCVLYLVVTGLYILMVRLLMVSVKASV